MSEAPRIVVLDDDPEDTSRTRRVLAAHFPQHRIVSVSGHAELADALGDPLDGFVTEYRLAWSDSLSVLHTIRGPHPYCAAIVLSRTDDPASIVEVMREGFDDYVLKGAAPETRLPQALHTALARARERAETDDVVRRYRSLYEKSPLVLIRTTSDGRFLDANPAAVRLFGFPDRASMLAASMKDLYAEPGERRAFLSAVEDAGGFARLEVERKDLHGRRLFFDTTTTAVRSPDGRVEYYDGAAVDITERQAAEHALEESEQRNRAILTALPDLLLVLGADGTFLDAHVPEGIGSYVPPEVFLGRTPREVLPPEAAEPCTAAMQRVLQTQQPEHVEYPLTIDGETRFFEARIVPCGTDKILSIVRDRTERKRAAEELALVRDDALAAARAKSAFLATMSHEVRTPLNGVLGMVGLMLDSELTETQRDQLETIHRSSDTLLGIVNDALDFSRVEAGRLTLEMLDFDLRAIVSDTIALLAERARTKGLELDAEVQATLPQTVVGDPGRLRQVLVNLVGNAVKFTDRGRVVVRVTSAQESDTAVALRVAVEDTGIGIAPDDRARIFEPFTQLDSSSPRRQGGSGLGLAISRQLIELMQGTIGVDSVPGQGSTFWFTVRLERQPAAIHSAPRTAGDRQPLAQARPTPTQEPAHVLVAEDSPVSRKVAVAILERLGYRVDAVTNGVEVVQALEDLPYDLVLMDCEMPEMDGLEATRRIRQRDPAKRTPIIALTAHAFPEDRERCLEAGMDDYLSKPVRPQDLATAVERWIARRR